MFLGPILHMENDEPANIYVLFELSHGRRPSERLLRSFPCQVQEWINDPNNYLSENDIMRIAQD